MFLTLVIKATEYELTIAPAAAAESHSNVISKGYKFVSSHQFLCNDFYETENTPEKKNESLDEPGREFLT